MKEIKAFIRPERLIEVTKFLKKENYCCFTVFEGEGLGKFSDPDTNFPSLKFPFLHNKIVKIEIVCKNEDVNNIMNIIKDHSNTGMSGDGLIYISNVEDNIRIKDGNVL